MKYFTLVLFLLLALSCSLSNHLNGIKNNEELYKVVKIKEENTYYIVYIQRNDSIFKVISDKINISNNCNRIKVKSKYKLELRKTAPIDSILGIPIAPNLGVTGMEMTDGSILEFEEKSHYTIYRTNNLDGLCLIKENDEK